MIPIPLFRTKLKRFCAKLSYNTIGQSYFQNRRDNEALSNAIAELAYLHAWSFFKYVREPAKIKDDDRFLYETALFISVFISELAGRGAKNPGPCGEAIGIVTTIAEGKTESTYATTTAGHRVEEYLGKPMRERSEAYALHVSASPTIAATIVRYCQENLPSIEESVVSLLDAVPLRAS